MATKDNFSSEEWKMLMEAPALAGLGVSMLDLGLVSFAKEFTALIRAVIAAKGEYPTNELIQSIAAEFETKNADGAPSPEAGKKKTSDEILSDIQRVAALVDGKAPPQEAREFKTFLFGVSEKVANASGSGFLGFGEKLSETERAYLARLRTSLSL